ncbi:ExbD/TolR family protein [Sanyastnella coralliicola]|uniref:ExbD/TolR family protein n=1 Tax=Sanyastnella coralliicola TaxID=3069118 RepID=UPI0027BACF16|nr:biopolymer transporter ExbD [Longitalea sp. SCSIO 12813]
MARRPLQEINAGSMADIAFLLLIFWLVTTTIDSDEGVKRQLPPPVPPDVNVPPVRERNVFVVLVNANNDLLVEGEELKIDRLKDRAKDFLTATGDGILYPETPEDPDLPVREWVRKAFVAQKVAEYEAAVRGASDPDAKKAFQKVLESWRDKLAAIDLLGGDYRQLPGSAIISMRNDRNTSYDTYIQVNNELEAAINELRDELSQAKFGMSYSALEEKYEKSPDELTRQKIFAVRAVYPQRISEAEPQDAGAVYN